MPNNNAISLNVLLLEGDPTGIKLVQIGQWTGESIVIPRQKLKKTKDRKECSQPALYFLIGSEQEDSILPTVYIGEAENLCDRLIAHEGTKDFWNTAIGFVGRNLNKAHVKYLESRCIKEAGEIQQCHLINKSIPKSPQISEADIAELEVYFENLKIILSVLGHNFLQEITSSAVDTEDEPIFECAGKGARATGRMSNQGFVVYKSSTASKKLSIAVEKSNGRIFEELKDSGYIDDADKDFYIFTKDFVFKSPSGASDIILGNSSNGWDKWKTKSGQTLDEVYRKGE